MALDPQAQALLNQMAASGSPPISSMSPAQVRQAMLAMRELAGSPEPVGKVEDRKLPKSAGNVAVRIYTPQGSSPFPVLVYFHGGGFVTGNLDSLDAPCRALCNRVGCLIVSVDYRLAPEHPFPTAVDDAYAATRWVAEHAHELGGDPKRLAVGGDSAGGTLAAVVALMARERGAPKLVYQVLLYPNTDATMSSASISENGQGYGLDKDTLVWFYNHYVPYCASRKNPHLSPLWAQDLTGLPPASRDHRRV